MEMTDYQNSSCHMLQTHMQLPMACHRKMCFSFANLPHLRSNWMFSCGHIRDSDFKKLYEKQASIYSPNELVFSSVLRQGTAQ